MKKLFLLLLLPAIALAQDAAFKTEEIAVNDLLKGTLYVPESTKKVPLLILLSGSGPTDRNGNQAGMENNSLKLLAEAAAKSGIAAYSYDKRIFAQMKSGTLDEKALSFDDFINDARQAIQFFRAQKKYSKIVVAGHSEGSLIGMVAANGNADGFISIAGAGRTIDQVVMDQVVKQAPMLKDELEKNFAMLKNGQTFELKDQTLAMLFRESVQPYMISWLKYDPAAEIKKLKIPVLIVNGTKDLQVPESEAKLLKDAKPDAKLEIIPDMNHVLKEISGGQQENAASYSDGSLPVSQKLASAVNQFIKTL